MSKLLSKHDKADSLFKLGYRAALQGDAILIKSPAGNVYRIDAEARTCSCPYAGDCSHILGLHALLLDTAASIDDDAPGCREPGNGNAYSRLGFERRARVVELQERAWEVLRVVEGAETMESLR